VGCGPISERHVLSWKAIPEVELVAVCDRHPENSARLASRHDIRKTYTDFHALLSDVECNVVDIATRPYSHRELVFLAARAGKNILCQKPFAPTLEEAREMIQACDEGKVRLMICENWRWFIWYQLIKQLLTEARIGDVCYFRMQLRNRFTIPHQSQPAAITQDPQTYLQKMERLLIYELAIHLLDVVRFLFGDPDSVYARTGRMSPSVRGEDFALLVLNFGRMHGVIDASWCSRVPPESAKSEYLLIEGNAGSILLDQTGRIRVVDERGESEYPKYDWQGETKLETHFRLHKHFVECILNDQPFQTDGRDNIKTLEIALKAYESAAGNAVIALQGDLLLSGRYAAE
jgi:predicted dehydrogenase